MIIQKKDSYSTEIALKALKQEKIVILPTDTIYGFSGIFPNTSNKIANIKGRDLNKPFIALVSSIDDILKYSSSVIPSKILDLLPAPITLILNLKDGSTQAFRYPKDVWLTNLISSLKTPIFSTSVNYSGSPAITSIIDIIKEFEDKVELIVSDGDLENKASTIIDLTNETPKILRLGDLKLDNIL